MTAYLKAMRNYFMFQGRAARSEYWLFTLFVVLIGIAAAVVDAIIGTGRGGSGVFSGLASLVHFIPSLAVGVRRMHDIDRSGWWLLAPLFSVILLVITLMAAAAGPDGPGGAILLVALIPIGFTITVFVFCCTRGTHGNNRFGPEPPETAGFRSQATSNQWNSSPQSRSPDTLGEIERLAKLRADGSLSEAEFSTLKAKALSAERPS